MWARTRAQLRSFGEKQREKKSWYFVIKITLWNTGKELWEKTLEALAVFPHQVKEQWCLSPNRGTCPITPAYVYLQISQPWREIMLWHAWRVVSHAGFTFTSYLKVTLHTIMKHMHLCYEIHKLTIHMCFNISQRMHSMFSVAIQHLKINTFITALGAAG